MAEQEFYPILTKTGKEKEMACLDGQTEFDIWEIAVGDGNGALYEPDENQTSLKNECWRGLVAKCENEDDTRYAIVHIPADIGGFTIREIGAFDKSGNLLIVAKCAETVKRLPETGDIKQLSIRLDLSVINELVLPFLIDPSINTATVEYCDKHYQNLNQKAQPEGYAPLDDAALLPVLHLPDTKHQLASLFPSKAYSQAEYPKEYAAIVEQASSSFDLSKVNYSGNPTITGDGLAVLAPGNRVILPVTPSMFKGKSWSITFRTYGQVYTSSYFLFYPNDVEGIANREMGSFGIHNNQCYFWGAYGENKTLHPWVLQTDLDYENYFDITYAFDISKGAYTSIFEGDTGVKTVKTYTPPDDYSDIKELYPIYNELDGNCILTALTQDLKNMRIVIDGEEIPLYAKTGIDTIKAPNYTVVGSPSISADGIASGFSGSSYIIPSLMLFGSNNWSFEATFIPQNNTVDDKSQCIFAISNKFNVMLNRFGTKIHISLKDPDAQQQLLHTGNIGNLNINLINKVKVIYANQTFYTYINGELAYSTTIDLDNFKFSNNNQIIGYSLAPGYNTFYGSIDLNSVKFYSNGDLVCQPCLHIPYTESTSGTKIVDAAYLDRVQDCFEHTGEARYIILDKENSNFYLPKGSVISMLARDKTNTDKLKNNIDTLAVNNLHPAAIPSFSNQEIYDYWLKQAHSTFGSSKFTVVGSPTISDDGIASGFSNSNYLSKTISLDSSTAFDLVFKFKTPETITTPNQVIGSSSEYPVISYRIDATRIVFCEFSISSATRHYAGSSIALKENTDYYGKISYGKSAVKFYYSENGIDFNILTTFNNIPDFNGIYDFAIGIGRALGNVACAFPFQGSIDLKNFSITVDGKKIFSGNKTAIDTIKAPNYTVVGSPNISEDGLLGTCRRGNGVVLNDITLADLRNKSWVVTGRSIYNGVISDDVVFKLSGSQDNSYISWGSVLISRGSKTVMFLCRTGIQGDPNNENTPHNKITYAMNDSYSCVDVALYFNIVTGVYTLYCAENGGEFTQAGTWTPTTNNKQLYYINVSPEFSITAGMGSDNSLYNKNLIDLNYFKVFINGVLSKQACLYIPYTESTSGTKIVDAAYLDRVQSCYEQTGQALYLTLDRSNQRVYQPKGSLTGFLSKNALSIAQNQSKIETNIEQISQINQDISSINDDISELTDSKAEKTDVVNLTGNQTIQDTKTFEEPIIGDLQGNSDSATVTKYSGDAVFPAQGSVEVPGELPVGLSFSRGYNSPENSPGPYGHLINLRSTGSANTQLFLSWNANNDTAAIYYRSHRESGEGAWTPWKTLAFTDSTVAKAVSDANGANIADTYLKKDMENLAEAIKSTIYATGSATNLKIPVDGTSKQVIIKSGGITSPAYITFPEAFPTACSNVVVTCHTTESCVSAAISDITRSGFNVRSGTHGGTHEDRTVWVSWIAIGY